MNAGRKIQRLPGMRDVAGSDYERLGRMSDTLASFLRESGYVAVDTPLMEETDLFVRKSGGELTSRLYTFTDPGGHRVSLRPEFTSSVIRYYIQEAESLSPPIRWQYVGPVFRYEPGAGLPRQFTQLGAELIGAGGVEADADIAYLAWAGLGEAGVPEPRIRLAHLGLLHGLLDSYEVSEAARLFLIGGVQDLQSGRAGVAALRKRAEELGLLRANSVVPEAGSGAATEEFIGHALREAMAAPTGRRSAGEIVSRLLRKLRESDDPARFEEAAALVSGLVRLKGPPSSVLEEGRRLVSDRSLQAGLLDGLGDLCELLVRRGVAEDRIDLDLGVARGISYYTGVVFDLTYSENGVETSLGGGGRYDGLVRALGGDADVPALGFAYDLDQVAGAVSGVAPDGQRGTGEI